MMILLQLFYEFFFIGALSIGGGLATVPFLQSLSERTGWFTLAELADMIAVAESTPGPIGINLATYVGFRTHGLLGVAFAVVGLVAPAIITIMIIARILDRFKDSPYVKWAFKGLRPASCALIAAAGFGLMRLSLFDGGLQIPELILFAALIVPMIKTKLHPLVFIGFSAVVGIIFKF